MRTMFLLAGAALALSACGGANEADEADTLAVNNVIVDESMTTDDTLNADVNAVVTDANTQNAIVEDLTTNDADTNLANGM